MDRPMRHARPLLYTLVLLVCACGDDATEPSLSDAGTPAVDAATKAVPLVEWVDDLVDHHTDDVSAPDTVDDKKIIDDEDPNTFNRRF
jgi:hypothetical protein